MNKVLVSLLLSLTIGVLLLACFSLSRRSADSCRSCERMGQEVFSLQGEIHSLREDTRALSQEVRGSERGPKPPNEAGVKPGEAPDTIDSFAVTRLSPASHPDGLKDYILSALQEDRTQREAKRQQLAEVKREKLATMKEGPYEKFNLKVNSLGKVLELTDLQEHSFYALSKQAEEHWKEARRLAIEPGNEAATAGGAQPRGPGSSGQLRQLKEKVQKEFERSVQQILTAPQLESYKQLSRSAHEFQNLEKVKPGSKGATQR